MSEVCCILVLIKKIPLTKGSEMTASVPRSAEFYFQRGTVNYTAFPNSWVENGSDMFDVVNTATDEFYGSFPVSPVQDVVEAFDEWFATQVAV